MSLLVNVWDSAASILRGFRGCGTYADTENYAVAKAGFEARPTVLCSRPRDGADSSALHCTVYFSRSASGCPS